MSYIIDYSRLASFLQRIRSHPYTYNSSFYIVYNDVDGNKKHMEVSYTLPYVIETFRDDTPTEKVMRAGRFMTASFEHPDKFIIAAKFYMENTSASKDFVRAVGNEYADYKLHLIGDTTIEEVEDILMMMVLTTSPDGYGIVRSL